MDTIFLSYLNNNGHAGFVMPSSATDAGNTEKKIRQKLIESGTVDAIVAISNNFFYTRSLPCHLWFLNKGKILENKDKILMIDARNTFRKVSTTINDFSPDQLEGLTAIMQSFHGKFADFTKNDWLKEKFPNGKYEDIEGLCKIVDIEEVKENDWSLTPGRYVGYSIQIDENFDYKKRMKEIHAELVDLHSEANELMTEIIQVEV